jgi:SAM-dependent methyltransferase
MTHRDATTLIDNAALRNLIASTQQAHTGKPARWADLGCGSGTFTLALAHYLPAGSTIDAIDLHPSIRPQTTSTGITIITRSADFVNDELTLQDLDGILMANALHYVRDKPQFLQTLRAALRPGGALLLIEYDTDIPLARWVPYPLSFAAASRLFTPPDWSPPQKLGERPSAFGRSNLYSMLTNII